LRDLELLLLSLLVSSAGLGLLFYTSSKHIDAAVDISRIDYDSVGSKVAVSGKVLASRTHRDGHVFLKLGDPTGNISVVFFSSLAERLDAGLRRCLKPGSYIQVEGWVKEYKGTLEVVPRKGRDVECLRLSP
jgi:DNA/RNA endonuclease YhcR with UshA esterase domain